jgi:hypothetical protein
MNLINFFSFVLAAVTMSATVAHLLELPAKIKLEQGTIFSSKVFIGDGT